ncbi:Putative mycofactocin biosynthesis glycosyltransferase MftF [Acaryochloris thomasi RCC1774]|uniref:Mycofactocin biosynthesis glycosyltransferase MftF n=1 Tax=Acaryochloris thomasi RCC1774 TaxID=1764569 RepID=A0A2W1JJX7_9CYAN|nr:glycosyltransferase [Acaryochloris thomasi]PZD71785.1 Putative mycofactocin biosynthesis glycosyltransferase MftF [Acaryochloris thomasi RCC1774]
MQLAYVSVIVPVFNDIERLEKCLRALEEQTYPKHLYEVIVIDNNSDEDIECLVASFKHVKLSFEAKQGSYAARNKGISLSVGEIFSFTDSDCIPRPQWIEKGVEALESNNADLVGGKVEFTFSSERTAAEIYDSVTNMQIEKNIASRKISKTANLFVRKTVFSEIGLFPGNLKSGGDVIWTKRATDANFYLVYSSEACVLHPARKLVSMLRKQYRVGSGQPSIWLEQGQSLTQIFSNIIFGFRPPSRKQIQQNCIDRAREIRSSYISIWRVAWLCTIATSLGRLSGFFMFYSAK